MACTLLRGQILIGVKSTLVGVKNTLSRGQILLGVRNTLVGDLKYFSGGQILIGQNFYSEGSKILY